MDDYYYDCSSCEGRGWKLFRFPNDQFKIVRYKCKSCDGTGVPPIPYLELASHGI